MQRRIDDPQRRMNTNEPFPRVIPPGGPRFGEVGDGGLVGSMPFPLSSYQQLNQPVSHHGPGPLSHSAVAVGATAPTPGTLPQSLHAQLGPASHQANIPVSQTPCRKGIPPPLSGGQQQQQQQQQQQFQRLKVEDALSYLDQVKLQFGNQPQVYNDFLDIMKEFKSQTIDTPGVINRVSNLFKGHPDLIVGFNTFLPPGYKIEVQCETINVHQPGQQVMSIAALAQSQAVSNVNRVRQKPGMSIWDVALASQATQQQQQQKVGPVHHAGLPTSTSSPADHRSYHQSPRPAADSSTQAQPLAQQQAQQQQQQQQQQGGQPVEFNHAINYVNKIKNRFQGQPDIYKQFLEILHTYQKEQRQTRDQGLPVGPAKPLTESEVYQQVANLFKHQEDLLAEFGQFLPDANGTSSYGVASFADSALGDHSSTVKKPSYSNSKSQSTKSGVGVKRPATSSASASQFHPPIKKKGVPKDISLADASKTGTLTEYAFFDKVRKALRHQDVYDNFLRAIVLYNQEIVSKQELVTLVSFFLSKFPDLFREFKDLLGINEQGGGVEAIPHGATSKERIGGELAMEIDFNTCKRYGASYRGIPSKYVPPKCSGRTPLCREVLNDTWVSFPTWSEDSSFVTSRKTQYEENIYKCEDERFELDYVIETNFSTIKNLEAVLKKMSRMAQEETAKFRLDNALGGSSESINRNSIHRIYGDKANDIIEGLKKNPVVAVPLVLRRLKAKDEEWREAQKQFNKMWKEQNEKFYLKSLDHQCANFKQHDIKAIRGKSLLNQIESIYDERADNEESPPQGPMLSFVYEDRSLLEDAATLIIHHVKRQTGVDKEAKTRIKQLVKQFIPDLFFTQRGELSDDDGDMNEDMDVDEEDIPPVSVARMSETSRRAKEKAEEPKVNGVKSEPEDNAKEDQKEDEEEEAGGDKKNGNGEGVNSEADDDDDRYSLFFCNSTWYIFLRLHQILCGRLLKAFSLTQKLIQEEALTKKERKDSVAMALRLRSPLEVDVDDYYSYFLEMVRAVLDGNMEAGQYEDTMREMYGINAYQLFTMDKVVQNIVRQAQHLVMDEVPIRLTQLFEEHRTKGGAGGRWATRHQRSTLEQAYLRKAESDLVDENPFKFTIHSLTAQMEIDMLDPPPETNESVKDTSAWSMYVNEYATDKKHEEFIHRIGHSKPIYLVRNKRRNKRWQQFKLDHEEKIKKEKEEEEEDVEDDDDQGDPDSQMKLDKEIKKEDGEEQNEEDDSNSSVKDKPVADSNASDKEKEDSAGKDKDEKAEKSNEPSLPSRNSAADLEESMEEGRSPSQASRTPAGNNEDEEEDDDKRDGMESDGDQGDDKKEGAESDGGLGDDEDDEEKASESASKRKKLVSSPDGGLRRMNTLDTTNMKFPHNSYHHMYVKNSRYVWLESDRLARTKACHKAVTQRKFSSLSQWTGQWLGENVKDTQHDECRRWLMGQAAESRDNRTSATEVEQLERTPYRVFTRYTVDWVAPSSGRTSPASAN